MTTLEDQIIAISAKVDLLTEKVEALAVPASVPVDLSPVLDAIAAIQAEFVATAPVVSDAPVDSAPSA